MQPPQQIAATHPVCSAVNQLPITYPNQLCCLGNFTENSMEHALLIHGINSVPSRTETLNASPDAINPIFIDLFCKVIMTCQQFERN